jgi:tetratricopeptide (TPR) repeat protein/transcriptional regulator with XRE-family HTH domain
MSGEAGGFGALLRARRQAGGLSQLELAEQSGLAVRTISDLERGRTRWPYPDSLHRLADALGLSGTARADFTAAAGRRLGPVAPVGRAAPAAGRAAAAEREEPGGREEPARRAAAAAAARGPVPRLLPAAVPGFVGRDGQVAALWKVLEQPGGTAVIAAIGGTAGVGKTTLAVHWAHQAAREFPDGQLFIDLRGFDPSGAPVRPVDAVRVLLDALEVRADRLPQTEEAQLGLYRSLLAGKRMLIVLDNARDAAQVRPLLPGAATCRTIVTSRNRLPGLTAIEAARPLMLDVLTSDEAHELLRQRLGEERVAAEPDAAARIVASCEYLPLALSVIAARAWARPELPLANVATALATSPALDALAAGGDPAADVRAAFSWSFRQLDRAAARVFRLASLHPGREFDAYAVAALAGISAAEAGRLLDLLAQACLLRQTEPLRFSLHDLLRSYARELAEAHEDERERRAAMTRLLDYYLQAAAAAVGTLYPAERYLLAGIAAPAPVAVPALTAEADAAAWLEAERSSLVAVTEYAAGQGWPRHATQLAALLFRHLDIRGHYPDALAIHGSALRAARQAGDQTAEGEAMRHLAAVRMRQRLYQEAADCYRQAVALCREAGAGAGEARALSSLGFVEFLQGRHADAIAHLRAALAIDRELGNLASQAHTLSNLGFIESRQGRYQQAAEYLRRAHGLFGEVGDRIGQAHALGNLGDAELRAGRYQDAVGHLDQALALCRQAGDRSNEADLLACLGDAESRQGRYTDAAAHLNQALELCRQTGDVSTQATVLNSLGVMLLAIGRVADARGRHASALRAATQADEKYEQARAHDGLAAACHAAGEQRKAGHHWKTALALYTELGAPEADQVRARLAGRLASSTPREAGV